MAEGWYATFFDDRYVEWWNAAGAFDDTAEEVEGIQALLPAPSGLAILDVPCGFGRISGPLHAAGHRVTGVDLSPDQLALAEERNPGPSYLQGDMRDPPAGAFDVVLNLYSSIGYFPERAQDQQAVSAWFDALKPGGILILTGNHRDRVAKLSAPGTAVPFGDSGVVEHPDIDWATGINHSRVTLPDGGVRHFDVRLYTVTDLVDMCRSAGFSQIEAWGDLNRAAVSPDTRLVLRARKAGEDGR